MKKLSFLLGALMLAVLILPHTTHADFTPEPSDAQPWATVENPVLTLIGPDQVTPPDDAQPWAVTDAPLLTLGQ